MVKFIYGEAKVGGSETLILRLARQTIKQKLNSELYCSSICKETRALFQKSNLNITEYGQDLKCEILNLDSNDICLTFAADHFFSIQDYVNKHSLKTKVFLYIVHPYTITKWFLKKSRLLKPFYKNVFESNINNGSIFFMDEQTVDETFNFYRFRIPKENARILRLPIDCTDNDLHATNNTISILSVARADFPFKGYFKGLIEAFESYSINDEAATLTIISYGKGIDLLRKWVDNSSCSSRIQLLENVNYDELNKYYLNASLYIGMGTTILEAASNGIPALVVAMYTYKCNTNGLFIDAPNVLALESNEGRDIIKYIEIISKMSSDDYYKTCLKSKRIIQTLYSPERIIEYLINEKNKVTPVPLLVKGHMLYRSIKHLI